MNRNENNVRIQLKWHSIDEVPEINTEDAIYDDGTNEYFNSCDPSLVLAVKVEKTDEIRVWESGYNEGIFTYGKFVNDDDSKGFYQLIGDDYDGWTVKPVDTGHITVVAWAFKPEIEIIPYKEV